MLTHTLTVHISGGSFDFVGYWAVQQSWSSWENALRNLLHKKLQKVTAATSGGPCFMLCITMEVESRIMKQYKCQYCCICKKHREKVMEKHLFIIFWLTRSLWVSVKKCFLASCSTNNKLLLPDTFWLWAFKNAFQAGTVNFTNSLSLPSIVKKVCTGSKSGQGT